MANTMIVPRNGLWQCQTSTLKWAVANDRTVPWFSHRKCQGSTWSGSWLLPSWSFPIDHHSSYKWHYTVISQWSGPWFGSPDGLVNFRTYNLIFPCWFIQWFWPPRGSLRESILWCSETPTSISCGAETPESCVFPSHIIWLPSFNLQTKWFYMPARGCVRSFSMNFWLLRWVMVSRRMEQARTWVTTTLNPSSTV